MVLRSNHRHNVLAVGKGQKRCFLALHKFFDDNACTRAAEFMLLAHHFVNGFQRFGFRHGNNYALACRKAVGLNNNRRAFFLNIVFGGFNILANFKERGRDIVFSHDVFGKSLAAFKLRSRFGRAEHSQPAGCENIGNACNQSCFRADNGQINAVFFGKICHSIKVV